MKFVKIIDFTLIYNKPMYNPFDFQILIMITNDYQRLLLIINNFYHWLPMNTKV